MVEQKFPETVTSGMNPVPLQYLNPSFPPSTEIEAKMSLQYVRFTVDEEPAVKISFQPILVDLIGSAETYYSHTPRTIHKR
jgi:hypothetical protein